MARFRPPAGGGVFRILMQRVWVPRGPLSTRLQDGSAGPGEGRTRGRSSDLAATLLPVMIEAETLALSDPG